MKRLLTIFIILIFIVSNVYADTETQRPTGDGNSSGTWTAVPADFTFWNKVEEVTLDTSDYNQSPTTTTTHRLYTYTDFSVPAGATINYLEVFIHTRKWGGGTNNVRVAIRVNGTNYLTTDPGVASPIFIDHSYQFTTNPDTGSAWTVDDINGSGSNPLEQFGSSSTDATPPYRVYQAWAVVDYTPAAGGSQVIRINMGM